MSYILDALKKSEKERQRGTVPDVMTAQDVTGEAPKKRSLWLYLIAGALVLNAGLLVWWLSRHPGGPTSAARPAATQASVAKAPVQGNQSAAAGSAVAPSPSKLPQTSEPIPKSAEERKPLSRPEIPSAATDVRRGDSGRQPRLEEAKTGAQRNNESNPAPRANQKSLSEIATVPPQQTPSVKLSDAESEPASFPVPVPNKLYSLQELPAPMRQGFPDFVISTHLFASEASSRMVRINGQLLREGEYLSAGLKLEEITTEGVIFSYQSYRFRVGLK